MTAPSGQATANIREASYYQEYQANVVKHRWFLAGEPARKPNPTTQKVQINILRYLIHLRMCKVVPTKMMKLFLLVENLRQQNPDNREMIYVDGVKCKSLSVARRRPLMSAWSAKVLKERETKEIASSAFGLGEKEGPFVEEDENGFLDDLEKLGNYIETIHKSKSRFEKTLSIILEVFPNHDMLIDLEEKYAQVQERKSDRVELIGFKSSEYAFGPVTLANILETAKRVTSAKLKGKAVDIDYTPSFNLGVTQDFEEYNIGDITVVSTKVIQPIQATPSNIACINASEILFETTNEHRSNRTMIESLTPSMAVEDNILDAWAEYLNFNKRLRNASSPLKAFLLTFVVVSVFN
nr:hypothetical protein [Tanacetum cinerariifolium]